MKCLCRHQLLGVGGILQICSENLQWVCEVLIFTVVTTRVNVTLTSGLKFKVFMFGRPLKSSLQQRDDYEHDVALPSAQLTCTWLCKAHAEELPPKPLFSSVQ